MNINLSMFSRNKNGSNVDYSLEWGEAQVKKTLDYSCSSQNKDPAYNAYKRAKRI